jgi:hypothetical protein
MLKSFLKNCKKMVKSAENRRKSRKTMTIEQEQKNRNCRSMVVFFLVILSGVRLLPGRVITGPGCGMLPLLAQRPVDGHFRCRHLYSIFFSFTFFFGLKLMKRILFKENSKRKSDRFQRKAASFVIKLILKLNLVVKLFVVGLISFLFI